MSMLFPSELDDSFFFLLVVDFRTLLKYYNNGRMRKNEKIVSIIHQTMGTELQMGTELNFKSTVCSVQALSPSIFYLLI